MLYWHPMKQEKIKKILNEQLEELTGLCEQVGKNFDKEAIHNFRVGVKSFRAFQRLLRIYSNDDKRFKIPIGFKRLYLIAGMIRDGQLALEKIAAKKLSFPAYARRLRETIQGYQDEWQKGCTKNILSEYKHTIASLKYEPLPVHALAAYIRMDMHTIRMLCRLEAPGNEDVHRIRKLAKDLIYTTKLIRDKWVPAYEHLHKSPTEQLEQIAIVIGEYNDDRVMFDNIVRFGHGPGSKQEKYWKTFCAEETQRLAGVKKKTLAIVGEVVHAFYT
jgi:CHAD domain-containing protein